MSIITSISHLQKDILGFRHRKLQKNYSKTVPVILEKQQKNKTSIGLAAGETTRLVFIEILI